MRNERDRRHWRLIDDAVAGGTCVFIARGRADAAVEHGRVMGLLGDEGIEPSRVRRGPHFDIDFPSGGHLTFIVPTDVRRRLRGMKIMTAMTSASLSHWDRRDVEASGATWI